MKKYNAKLLPQSTSLQEHTGVYPVVVRGALHSSSSSSSSKKSVILIPLEGRQGYIQDSL